MVFRLHTIRMQVPVDVYNPPTTVLNFKSVRIKQHCVIMMDVSWILSWIKVEQKIAVIYYETAPRLKAKIADSVAE